MESIKRKYEDCLNSIPPQGQGMGCHQHILRTTNYGVMLGLDDHTIFSDISSSPNGTSKGINQIWSSIKTSRKDIVPFEKGKIFRHPKERPVESPFDELVSYITEHREEMIQRMIEKGEQNPHYRNYLESPMDFSGGNPLDETLHLLKTLYFPDDSIFIGNRMSKEVNTVEKWIETFETMKNTDPKILGEHYSFIIPNILSGNEGETSSGGLSKRCDSCVCRFKYYIGEFDTISKEDQIKFWWGINLPVVCLIDTGGKSIHSWIRVDNITRKTDWDSEIKNGIFRLLGSYGIDTQCSNPSRLSRLPGIYRNEKQKYQKLLYINPNGGLPS